MYFNTSPPGAIQRAFFIVSRYPQGREKGVAP
jgi:hypothetical protein